MFSHIVIGADDLDASKAFYDAALGVLGAAPGVVDAKGRVVYSHNGGRFLLTRPVDGGAASFANGGTIGFLCASPEMVDAWHAAGVAHGGSSCEDPPGIRQATEGRIVYLAYMRDPAGNKLCGFHKVSG
jgi:catechol 2,3-dioxygenase-like lactoylglutathione lyase family enzyme